MNENKVLFTPWQPDPENGLYLGLVYSNPTRGLPAKDGLPAGRFDTNEQHQQLRADTLLANGPETPHWHRYDADAHIDGVRMLARSATAAILLTNYAHYTADYDQIFAKAELAEEIAPRIDTATYELGRGGVRLAVKALMPLYFGGDVFEKRRVRIMLRDELEELSGD